MWEGKGVKGVKGDALVVLCVCVHVRVCMCILQCAPLVEQRGHF